MAPSASSFDFKAKGAWPRYFNDKVRWVKPHPLSRTDIPLAYMHLPDVAVFERAILEVGISVNHMTSTYKREQQAVLRFFRAMNLPNVYTPSYRGPSGAWIKFLTCSVTGASTSHAPVFILDGKIDEFDPRALQEAWCIPAPIDGVMPVAIATL